MPEDSDTTHQPKSRTTPPPTRNDRPMTMREIAQYELDIRQEAEREDTQQRTLTFYAELVELARAWIDWSKLQGVATEAAKLFLEAYSSVRKDELDEIGESREAYADDSAFQTLQDAHASDPKWVDRNLKSINHGVNLAKRAIHTNYPRDTKS